MLLLRYLEWVSANFLPNVRAFVLCPRGSVTDAHAGARSTMKHKISMCIIVETRDDRDAAEIAKKLQGLLKTSLVRMAIQSEGIRLAHEDGRPVVYAPQREP